MTMRIRPAPYDFGVVFRRVDCSPPLDIQAHYSNVSDTSMSTSISSKGATVATVEHFLSAVVGLHVDNLLIEIDGPELPIMDGSSAPFVFLLRSAGLIEQDRARQVLVVKQPIYISEGQASCVVTPYHGFSVAFKIGFNHPCIDQTKQYARYDYGIDSYDATVARARTFGFMSQVEMLRKRNLIQGASTKNAVVLDDHGVVNQEGLRSDDEFVKHKILDAIGDLALMGVRLQGAFEGVCSGHGLNKRLIDKIMASGDYEILPQAA